MSVETRSLSRALLLALIKRDGRAALSDEVDAACWDRAEKWDAEGNRRAAIEEKNYVAPHPTKDSK